MSGTTVTASTSVVLVPTSSNYTRPYIVTFPNISTTGRLITVRDNDGFVSTGNIIVLSTTAATTFVGMGNTITITQPYGFITLASQANGSYSILNTFAFPAGQAAANVSNLNAQVVNIQSTLNMYDFGTASTNTIYTSSGQFIFNGDYIGQVTDEQLASTVTNLGTTGYLSSIPFVYVIPPTWIAVGQSSTISQATSTGSIQYSSNDANWSNATGGKGFAKFGTAVTYGEGYYIAVGNNDSGSPNTGYNQWSFDGRDWYYSYGPSLSAAQMRTACLYANGLYHSVGCNNGVGGPNTILYSEDGKSWLPSTGNPFFTTDGTGYATGIAFGSGNGYAGVWVCSGVQNQGAAASLLWSSNGSNWNPSVNPMPFGSGEAMDVTFDGNKFVALCVNGTTLGGYNVCISFDGSNWFGSNITGGNFANQPRYVTGSNGVFVATTGNPGQSLVYSLDGGNSWQSNTNLSGCNLPMYKPYYDGLRWWVGVETTGGAQSMFYSTEVAPALSTWVNGSFTGGFSNGGIARAFTSTDGQSNVTAILNSTIFGLSQTFTTCNLNASTISSSKAFIGELNASTLYIGVTFVSTTYETVNNISTQNVDFISAGTMVSSSNFMDSLSVNRVSVGQIIGGSARLASLSTNTISTNIIRGATGIFTTANLTDTTTSDLRVNSDTIHLGTNAGIGQGAYGIAIGTNAGSDQGANTIAIGPDTGLVEQGSGSIAIGTSAGSIQQGANSIAIGNSAGYMSQPGNSIIINASGSQLNGTSGNALFINPVRSNISYGASLQQMFYNTGTSEVTYGTSVISSFAIVYADSISTNTISSGTAYIAQTNMSSLNVNFLSSGQTVGGPAQFISLSTNTISAASMLVSTIKAVDTFVDIDGAIRVKNGALIGGFTNISSALTVNTQISASSIITRFISSGMAHIGQLGINTGSPTQALDVNGSVWARSTLYVGANTTTNQIRFYGTNNDSPGTFDRTVIGEYLYGGTEQSELILFKGDDDGSGLSGPDRVRVIAAGGFRVDTGAGGTWSQGSAPTSGTYQNALFVSGTNGNVGINNSNPLFTLDVFGTSRATQFGTATRTTATTMRLENTNGGRRFEFYTNLNAGNYGNMSSNGDMAIVFSDGSIDTGNMWIGPHSAGAKGIKILSNGNVGIGTGSPGYTLDVAGEISLSNNTQTARIIMKTNGGISYIQSGSNDSVGSANKLYFTSIATTVQPLVVDMVNSRVGIGNKTNPATTLDVNGDIYTSGTITATTGMSNGGNLSNTGRIYIFNDGTQAAPAIVFPNPGGIDYDSGIYHPADGEIAVSINNSQRLLVTGSLTSNAGAFYNNGTITQNGQRTVSGVVNLSNGATSATLYTANRLGILAIAFVGSFGNYYYRLQGIYKNYDSGNFSHRDLLTDGGTPYAQVTSGTAAGVTIAVVNNIGSQQDIYYTISWMTSYG
jgi:hypothetical protein